MPTVSEVMTSFPPTGEFYSMRRTTYGAQSGHVNLAGLKVRPLRNSVDTEMNAGIWSVLKPRVNQLFRSFILGTKRLLGLTEKLCWNILRINPD